MSLSKKTKKVYITTTLPYVNSDPHIGFALEIIQADVFARYQKMLGNEVFLNTGTDEHGVKVYQKAIEQKKDAKRYVDEYAEKFRNLIVPLGISSDIHFIRTTDAKHKEAVQEFWRLCVKSGDIYKKIYKIKYCFGCELEKTDSELVEGKCPIHPNLEIEIREEENYFFRLSRFQEKLKRLYIEKPDFVIPDFRFNEIKAFAERGFEDFSISRLAEKMPWGVAVPEDPTHVMYVWFDAFVNYISTIGWPNDKESFQKWWIETGGVIQFAGKDQIRQQAAMWQAMLMSVGLPPSKQIVIHGFLLSNGQKMSKSVGNVVNPLDIVNEYGTDALRYYLMRHVHPFEDSDFTMEKFKIAYNADLANGLGNLFSRVLKMATMNCVVGNYSEVEKKQKNLQSETHPLYALGKYQTTLVCENIWNLIQAADKYIQDTQPFKVIKNESEKAKSQIKYLLEEVYGIAKLIEPIMPETSEKIKKALVENKMPDTPLFPRKD
jgi:methionyl-tRNA synthetase